MRNTFMNKLRLLGIVVFFLSAHSLYAQTSQMPFVFTLYGGLYFPSNIHFADEYRTHSDLLWGGGVALPVENLLYLTVDEAFFRTKAFVDPAQDSSASLSENFVHVGVLLKQPVSRSIFFRLMGGVNYVTVNQSFTSPQAPEQTLEAEKKMGFFAGCGVEEMFPDGTASLFGDIVYDYRRSHEKELEGDWGGVRIILGAHLFLF
jgi:hypothetical protein